MSCDYKETFNQIIESLKDSFTTEDINRIKIK